jgi:NACHT domain
VHSAIQNMHDDVILLKTSYRQDKISLWLHPPEPAVNYNKALQQRLTGSGHWFLRGNHFTRWKSRSQSSAMWLYGIPGCGKTILSSTILEDLKKCQSAQPIIYFYFDFNDANKQTFESMLRSLVIQIYHQCEDTRRHLDSLYSEKKDQQLNCEDLCKVLLLMIQQLSEVWIILDALDECTTRKGSQTEGLLSWVGDILKHRQLNVHILITSRPEEDIKSAVDGWSDPQDRLPIQSDLISQDISDYIRKRVREGEELKRWQTKPDVQGEIETVLMEKAGGM